MTILEKLFNDDRAIELPINIVVMLVVGMVALAALVAIIPPPTKNMSVTIDSALLQQSLLVVHRSTLVPIRMKGQWT